MLYIIGGILALGLGIYIGLGMPGMPGPENRVLPKGRTRRKKDYFTPLDLLRKSDRPSDRRRER
ncbi:MAG: hypothetical protein ACOCUW_03120 [Gemmatimonadota bacterium]